MARNNSPSGSVISVEVTVFSGPAHAVALRLEPPGEVRQYVRSPPSTTDIRILPAEDEKNLWDYHYPQSRT